MATLYPLPSPSEVLISDIRTVASSKSSTSLLAKLRDTPTMKVMTRLMAFASLGALGYSSDCGRFQTDIPQSLACCRNLSANSPSSPRLHKPRQLPLNPLLRVVKKQHHQKDWGSHLAAIDPSSHRRRSERTPEAHQETSAP